MTRMRTLLIACVVCALAIGGFLTGRATAQQVSSGEIVTPYEFPMSWGTFKTVEMTESGFIYFFEAVDGTIRRVDMANGWTRDGKGPDSILRVFVIQRSGTPPQAVVPGTLR